MKKIFYFIPVILVACKNIPQENGMKITTLCHYCKEMSDKSTKMNTNDNLESLILNLKKSNPQKIELQVLNKPITNFSQKSIYNIVNTNVSRIQLNDEQKEELMTFLANIDFKHYSELSEIELYLYELIFYIEDKKLSIFINMLSSDSRIYVDNKYETIFISNSEKQFLLNIIHMTLLTNK